LLILGRRINQSIVFPNCGITVRILDVNGRVAKIGIEAPRNVAIMRGELAMASSGSHSDRSGLKERSAGDEHFVAPEPEFPVLQLPQRLAEIKAGLHLFQQRRAAGDEMGADKVLGELLNEIAHLDADWLKGINDSPTQFARSSSECVSESWTNYQIGPKRRPIQILVVNPPDHPNALSLPVGTFHGCQLCTVNNHETALRAVTSNESFDYVVCNGSPLAFDELALVRTIRANRRLDDTRIFMPSVSRDAMEHVELSKSYRIDGWLARPLVPQDLWKHIVESEQLEF
jgi:carbon storage regulator CsrA